jgi:hypothetical protein
MTVGFPAQKLTEQGVESIITSPNALVTGHGYTAAPVSLKKGVQNHHHFTQWSGDRASGTNIKQNIETQNRVQKSSPKIDDIGIKINEHNKGDVPRASQPQNSLKSIITSPNGLVTGHLAIAHQSNKNTIEYNHTNIHNCKLKIHITYWYSDHRQKLLAKSYLQLMSGSGC